MSATFSDSGRQPAAALLHRLAANLRAAARRALACGTHLDAWLANRRTAAIARRDLNSMSDCELKDIGITRVDVERVARGASNRDAPWM